MWIRPLNKAGMSSLRSFPEWLRRLRVRKATEGGCCGCPLLSNSAGTCSVSSRLSAQFPSSPCTVAQSPNVDIAQQQAGGCTPPIILVVGGHAWTGDHASLVADHSPLLPPSRWWAAKLHVGVARISRSENTTANAQRQERAPRPSRATARLWHVR